MMGFEKIGSMCRSMFLIVALCLWVAFFFLGVIGAPFSFIVYFIRTKSMNVFGLGIRGPWRVGISGVCLGRVLKKNGSVVWVFKLSIIVEDGLFNFVLKVKERMDLFLLFRV